MSKKPPKRGRGQPSKADPNHPIVKRRVAKGWTQAQLAEAAGLAHITVAALERRECLPTLRAVPTLRALAAALGVGVETLAVELLLRQLRQEE